jgi:hypothetical protein
MKKDASAPAEDPARPEPDIAPVAEASRPQFRLELDHDDVYFGCEELGGETAVVADDVVLDHAPDNAPGQYRWLRAENRFHPLPKAQQKTEPGAPTLEQAFYDLLVMLAPEPAAKFAPRIQAWAAAFEKTIDGKGTKS